LVSQGAAERVFGHSWAKPQRVAWAVRMWVNRCFSSMFLSKTTLVDNAGQDSVINISFLLDVGIFHLPRLCLCYISEVWSAWRCPHDIELYHVNIMNTTWRLFFNYITYECYMNITCIFCTTHDITIVGGKSELLRRVGWSPTQVTLMSASAKRNGPGGCEIFRCNWRGEGYSYMYIHIYICIYETVLDHMFLSKHVPKSMLFL